MRVAILTMFNGVSKIYSLANVVAEHITMMLQNGLDVVLVVNEQFDDNSKYGIYLDERIEYRKIVNTLDGKQIKWIDYRDPRMKLHESFYREADVISESMIEALSDVSVCFMHDILYQGWHYVHNVAIRKAQKKLPDIKFIAFTHSFPVNRPLTLSEDMKYRYIPMDNTIFVYPSYSGIEALAKQYDVAEGLCRVIYNSLSLTENMTDAVKYLHSQVNLLDTDILIIYPARLTTGKQSEKIAALAGAITTLTEKTVKIVFCDFKCMDTDPNMYKTAIRAVGDSYGLNSKNIVFTSDYGFNDGFPRESVLELFTLSNLYICPSKSESFGLSVIEAASRGNFLVLNENVPALSELGKNLKAYFMEWDARNLGYDIKAHHSPSEAAYYGENARNIINMMYSDKAIFAKTKIRTRFSDQWIWNNQIKPLIYSNI